MAISLGIYPIFRQTHIKPRFLLVKSPINHWWLPRSTSHGSIPESRGHGDPEECEICTMFVEPNERHWSCGPCGFRICKTCAIEIMQGTLGELANGNKKGDFCLCDLSCNIFFGVLMGYNHQIYKQSKAAWWFWGQHFISTIVSDTLVQGASGHWQKVVMMMADCNIVSAMFLVRSCII